MLVLHFFGRSVSMSVLVINLCPKTFHVIMMFVFAACCQVPTVQRGHAHQERPAREEICAVPLQLSPDLQEQQPEDRLPQVT